MSLHKQGRYLFYVGLLPSSFISKDDAMKYPTEYRIEVYLDSFRNDPIAGFCSTTPLMPMFVGDEIDPYAWSKGNDDSFSNRDMVPNDHILEVVKVRHLMMIVSEHTIQSVSVKVKAIPREN